MSSIETTVKQSKRIESLLTKHFNAEGRGLHEKVSSCEAQLPNLLVRQIRWIATLRNKAVHEDEFELKNSAEFERRCDHVVSQLQLLIAPKASALNTRAATMAELNSANGNPASEKSKMRISMAILLIIVTTLSYLYYAYAENQQQQRFERQQQRLQLANAAKQAKAQAAKQTNQAQAEVEPDESQPQPSNTQSVSVSLQPGSLAQKAQQAKSDLQQAKDDIRTNLLEQILTDINLSTDKVMVSANADGTVNLLLPVDWTIPTTTLLPVINRYLHDYKGRQIKQQRLDTALADRDNPAGITISRIWNSQDNQKLPYSHDLYQWLTAHQVKLVANFGDRSAELILASGRDCHVSCRGVGNDEFQIMTTTPKPRTPMMFSKQRNPMVVASLPMAALTAEHQLTLKLVVTHKDNVVSSKSISLNEPLQPQQLLDRIETAHTDYQHAQQRIEQIKQIILEQTELVVGEVQVKANKDGSSNLIIPINWKMPHSLLLAEVNRYFHQYRAEPFNYQSIDFDRYPDVNGHGLRISRMWNRDELEKQPNSEKLLAKLMADDIVIRARIGDSKGQLGIATAMDCHVSCRLGGDDEYHIRFSGKQESIVISNVSDAQLAQASELKLTLERN
ncbi:hypothetical protein [Ferrimonas lipolytica]|uniref:DUF4145 domain-containing protein n=1 Tax=Ferrimonas lipolytica TaxID=2724191 RepID=A0A6H1UEQ8_9GAMM|nr:hypothetical protein [Ferrimonas lipolytica]QIZ77080.1 hypothetical protein HER31_09400 [Ferrimonas lipolytica]